MSKERRRRIGVLLNIIERVERFDEGIEAWVDEAKLPRERWFRETVRKVFFPSLHESLEEALKDPNFLKKVYEEMYPSFLTIKPSFEEFIQKIEPAVNRS